MKLVIPEIRFKSFIINKCKQDGKFSMHIRLRLLYYSDLKVYITIKFDQQKQTYFASPTVHEHHS